MQLSKLTEVEVNDVNRERENESRLLKKLMMRLPTMISLRECEESDCPKGS